ncbi:protein cornichon homolog 1-like [Curcuma longa]|uniref:protein cornichon homolog 1-like n=1 Tax=Curcuma longa TaxID=136217 RepID=UPI003D9EFD4C
MVYFWLTAFFLLVALIVLVIYQLMCLADLEFDHINPYDSASQINKVIYPEFGLQGFLCLLFLLSGNWWMVLLSVPYLYYNARLYQRRQHLIDVTEIFNQLNQEKKRRLFKLINLVILLFLTLFWMIYSILEDDE